MVVQSNIQAFNANRMYGLSVNTLRKSGEKLSSGYRVNRAADDAANLAISEKMRRQVRGLDQAVRNARDGVCFCQIADGALNEASEIINRSKELAIQAANGTNSLQDREFIQQEMQVLVDEIDRIHETTEFNLFSIFHDNGAPPGSGASGSSGSVMDGGNITFMVGTEAGQCIVAKRFNIRAETIFGGQTMDVSTEQGAADALGTLNTAAKNLAEVRSYYGALQNRLEHTANNLANVGENTSAAESRIRDTDMPLEMMRFSNTKILQSAGEAVLSQANQSNAGVLKMLS